MEDYTGDQHRENSSKWIERNLKNGEIENIEWKRIENTPFTLAGGKIIYEDSVEIEAWKIFCGHQIATYAVFESEQEAREYVGIMPWDLITVAIESIIEQQYKSKKGAE